MTARLKKTITCLQIAMAAIFILYALFYKLGNLPYRIWDESRLITSAYEMQKGGSLIVTTINGAPDMWNTKPPLMIWAQAASIKLLGLSEFSSRFPAAFCALLTILLVAYFIRYVTKNNWASLLSVIVLSTSVGFIGFHCARNGDYDSMLTFFTTAYLVCLFMYTEHDGPKRNRYLLLFFVFLTGAVLTKGIAGMLFAPVLALYIIFRKQLISTLTNKYFYVGTLAFAACIVGYYLLREHYNPGYLQAVYENELGGRFSTVNEGHEGPWHFYWDAIRWRSFGEWYWVLPSAIVALFFMGSNIKRRAMAFSLFAAILFIVIISSSATKLEWYSMPAYPLFAIVAGLLFNQLANVAALLPKINRTWAIVLLITIFSVQPTWNLYNYIKRNYDDLEQDSFYSTAYYFKDIMKGNKELKKETTFLYSSYSLQFYFMLMQ